MLVFHYFKFLCKVRKCRSFVRFYLPAFQHHLISETNKRFVFYRMIIAVLSSHHEKGDVNIIENKLAWVETK